jgi:hypothetical protein
MTTLARAQKAIDKAGIPLNLIKGEGYHYFEYDIPERNIFESFSVYVPYTSTYSAVEWVNQAWVAYEEITDAMNKRVWG